MAIPSRQIGWSTKANLLWQISKQLERLTCVTAGGCGQTTNYNVAGCERMEYHVISYTGSGILPEGTIVQNETPECWYIIDQTTAPADVGTVQIVWNTLGNCNPCIDSHTTTTTSTTTAPVYTFNSQFSETSNYDLCTSPSYDPNLYTLSSTLGVGVQLFSSDALDIPIIDGWYLVDGNPYHVTGGNGFITELGIPCGDFIVNSTNQFVDCIAPCGDVCGYPFNYFNVYMTLTCSVNFPTIGCEIWLNGEATIPFPDGIYNNGNGNCITITDGVITNVV